MASFSANRSRANAGGQVKTVAQAKVLVEGNAAVLRRAGVRVTLTAGESTVDPESGSEWADVTARFEYAAPTATPATAGAGKAAAATATAAAPAAEAADTGEYATLDPRRAVEFVYHHTMVERSDTRGHWLYSQEYTAQTVLGQTQEEGRHGPSTLAALVLAVAKRFRPGKATRGRLTEALTPINTHPAVAKAGVVLFFDSVPELTKPAIPSRSARRAKATAERTARTQAPEDTALVGLAQLRCRSKAGVVALGKPMVLRFNLVNGERMTTAARDGLRAAWQRDPTVSATNVNGLILLAAFVDERLWADPGVAAVVEAISARPTI